MIRRAHLVALMVGLSAMLATSAGWAQTSGESTTDKMKAYSVEKKNEAVAYGNKMMTDLGAKIKALETQISKDTAAAKADAARDLQELKGKQAATSKKLSELGQSTSQSWDATKQGFADAYKDLQQTYDKTVAKLKK